MALEVVFPQYWEREGVDWNYDAYMEYMNKFFCKPKTITYEGPSSKKTKQV